MPMWFYCVYTSYVHALIITLLVLRPGQVDEFIMDKALIFFNDRVSRLMARKLEGLPIHDDEEETCTSNDRKLELW